MEGEFLAPTTKVDYPSTLDKHNTKGKPAIDNYRKLYKPKNEIVEVPKFKLIHFTSYNRAMPGTLNHVAKIKASICCIRNYSNSLVNHIISVNDEEKYSIPRNAL